MFYVIIGTNIEGECCNNRVWEHKTAAIQPKKRSLCFTTEALRMMKKNKCLKSKKIVVYKIYLLLSQNCYHLTSRNGRTLCPSVLMLLTTRPSVMLTQ